MSHCSTSSLVSDNNYIPVGLTGEAARSLLGTSNHAAPTKAGKKNRKRRAKQKSNSTEKHSINDDSIYNGHLSQESNVEETQYIEESNPIFTDQQPPVIISLFLDFLIIVMFYSFFMLFF